MSLAEQRVKVCAVDIDAWSSADGQFCLTFSSDLTVSQLDRVPVCVCRCVCENTRRRLFLHRPLGMVEHHKNKYCRNMSERQNMN